MAKTNNQTDKDEWSIKQRVAKYLDETSFNDKEQKLIRLLNNSADGMMSGADLRREFPPEKNTGKKKKDKKDKRDKRFSNLQSEINRRLKSYGVKIGSTKDKMGLCFKKIGRKKSNGNGAVDATLSNDQDINDQDVNEQNINDQENVLPIFKQEIERCLLILCMRYGLQSLNSDNKNDVVSENQEKMTLEQIATLYQLLYEKGRSQSETQKEDQEDELADRENFDWGSLKEEEQKRLKKRLAKIVKNIIYKKPKCLGCENMIERGYIIETEDKQDCRIKYEMGQKGFHILKLDKDFWFDNLQPLIFSKGNTSSFSDTLHDINQQMDDFLYFDSVENDKVERSEQARRFDSFGIRRGDSERIQKRIILYNKLDYIRNALDISYIDPDSGMKEQKLVKTGLLVYSRDKDNLFLIGQTVDKNGNIVDKNGNCLEKVDEIQNNDLIIIADSDVNSIRKTEIENGLYGESRFEELFKTMFVASVDPVLEVELLFKDFGNIRGKVERLKKSRSTEPTVEFISSAEIDEQIIETFRWYEDEPNFKLIRYHDYVSGLEDLAKYLRGFGSSVLVVQPPQLIDRMRDSVERSLNAYREEGYFA